MLRITTIMFGSSMNATCLGSEYVTYNNDYVWFFNEQIARCLGGNPLSENIFKQSHIN